MKIPEGLRFYPGSWCDCLREALKEIGHYPGIGIDDRRMVVEVRSMVDHVEFKEGTWWDGSGWGHSERLS